MAQVKQGPWRTVCASITVRHRHPAAFVLGLLTFVGPACADYRVCQELTPSILEQAPESLFDTGLYSDPGGEVIAPGVLAFSPRFPVWSDGAGKNRWIYLPPGTQVDTRNMDAWQFPAGTKLWKEFLIDGVRVETRLLHKLSDADEDWFMGAYVWEADGSDAILRPEGVVDVGQTSHNVPAAAECAACHNHVPGRVLGFSAIQLTSSDTEAMSALAAFSEHGLLSHPPEVLPQIPGDPETVAALGYLHANCGSCHSRIRPDVDEGPRCYDPWSGLDLALSVDALSSVEATGVYQTAMPDHIRPGDAERSPLMSRFRREKKRDQMPPIASERMDRAASQLLEDWINGL